MAEIVDTNRKAGERAAAAATAAEEEEAEEEEEEEEADEAEEEDAMRMRSTHALTLAGLSWLYERRWLT